MARFLLPDSTPASVSLTAVQVPHPSRPGHWLPGLYWQREGTSRAETALLMLPGLTVRAGDFPPGTTVTVTVEVQKEEDRG